MAEAETLSPWWRRSAIVTIVLCFCVLGWLAKLTYSGAPPIPERVVGPDGAVLFTDTDIAAGQQVFLRYGLMENGTIGDTALILGPTSRLPGDLIFIAVGVAPLVIAAVKTYFGLFRPDITRGQDVAGEAA